MIYLPELNPYTCKFVSLEMTPLIIIIRLRPGSHLVAYDPVYLDNLLARMVVERATQGRLLASVENDGYWLPLPLRMAWKSEAGFPLWDSSIFSPIGDQTGDIVYLHKRSLSGCFSHPKSIKTVVGRWMERRIPVPTILCSTWQARCIGHRETIQDLLSGLTHIGKHRNRGFGEVAGVEVEPGDFVTALIQDGHLTHSIPGEAAEKVLGSCPADSMLLVGWTPPQWNPILYLPGWRTGTSLEE